jgi:protein-L-isoaspartate(D-aspartate) O-methyltransferase
MELSHCHFIVIPAKAGIQIFLLAVALVMTTGINLYAEDNGFEIQRERMAREQLELRGIKDKAVLSAMRKVERQLFVPSDLAKFAYADGPLPIGYDQTISQPYIVAYMTEAAMLEPEDSVLEIGTGSGYQAAILAEIVSKVYTIEIIEPLAQSAKKRLKTLGYDNIKVKLGDGYKGWKEFAPYEVIIVTAAPPAIPDLLLGQLAIGGRMVIPIGSVYQELYLITRTETGYDKQALLPVRFVPMVRNKD